MGKESAPPVSRCQDVSVVGTNRPLWETYLCETSTRKRQRLACLLAALLISQSLQVNFHWHWVCGIHQVG